MDALFFWACATLAGILVLVGGARLFLDNSISLGKRFGLSGWIVGLLVVSVGTSLPELASSLAATVQGATGIASGNVFGSNIANVFLVLGLPLLFVGFRNMTLAKNKKRTRGSTTPRLGSHHILYFFVSMVLVALSCVDGVVSRLEGLLLLLAFVGYAWLSVRDDGNISMGKIGESRGLLHDVFLALLGLGLLYAGARASVLGLVELSGLLGVSQGFLGATILAIGTSLPELSVTIIGVIKGRADVALGDVVGSNVFNGLVVLGLCALVAPVLVEEFLAVWGAVLLLATVALVFLAERAERFHSVLGLVLVVFYFLFVWFYYCA